MVSRASATPAGIVDAGFWRGRKVLVTGHTGFIGGWCAAWLHVLGAEVTGFALAPPTVPSFHDLTGLATRLRGIIADVRSPEALDRAWQSARPDVVLHLAAQPLVRIGHEQPVETFATNLMGTVNVLDCVRRHGAQAAIVMTSDKVYGDTAEVWHVEADRLGAGDPYGASKVCCEVAAEAFGRAALAAAGIGLATVRAGNVIGGGDWGLDRLVPDAIRAFSAGRPLALRRPVAVRPWQHVLDAVSGLLLAAQEAARHRAPIGAWNIGPRSGEVVTVAVLAEHLARAWGEGARVVHEGRAGFPETRFLAVDASRARRELGFAQPWGLDRIVDRTVTWYRGALAGEDAWAMTMHQIDAYQDDRVRSPATAPV